MTTKATPESEQATPIDRWHAFLDDLDAIEKNVDNPFGSKSRGIDDMVNAVGRALRKNRLWMSTEVINSEPMQDGIRITMRYAFYADLNQPPLTTVEGVGEGKDRQDKGSSKAQSAAYKYALGQGLSIPFTYEDHDASDGVGDAPPNRTTSTPAAPDRAALVTEYAKLLTKADSTEGVTVPDAARSYGDWNVKQLQGAINKINGLLAEASS